MSTTTTTITPEQAAEMFKLATTSATKWAFLDGVASMCAANPMLSQKDVVDMIGDTATFQAMHGDHRDHVKGDPSPSALKAMSKLKSIRDELSVVKTWAPADRVDGVSFEAHKILNRIGADAGNKILTSLVKEMGGPGNVTKAAVAARLKATDPDHKPQANGKTPAAGNQAVTASGQTQAALVLADVSPIELARELGGRLTVGDLARDADLAAAVMAIADIYEAHAQRKAAKDAGKAKPVKKAAAKSTPAPKAPSRSVRTPSKRASVKAPAAPKRPASNPKPAPKVKTPA